MTVSTIARDPSRMQYGYAVRPILDLATFGPLEHVVQELQAHIRRRRYARGEGTVVLCSPEGDVYALAASELRTERFVADHAEWVVGWYATKPAKPSERPRVPPVSVLLGDLEEHLQEVR